MYDCASVRARARVYVRGYMRVYVGTWDGHHVAADGIKEARANGHAKQHCGLQSFVFIYLCVF